MQRPYLQSARRIMQSEIADNLLLQRANANDQEAFEMLVHRYQSRLYSFACRHLNSEQAQDVTQFVLLQLYLAIPGLLERSASTRYSSSLKNWLFRVARNRCVDEQRKYRRQTHLFLQGEQEEEEESLSLLATLCDPAQLPEELVEAKERRDQLHDAIQTLPPTLRAVVWLRYTEGLTFTAIANRLNMPSATTKTYFYRACARLRVVFLSQEREQTNANARAL